MEMVLMGLLAIPLLIALSVIYLIKAERDAVDGLIAYLVVLYLIPARIVFPGGGAVGTPAVLVGLLLFMWWLLSKALPTVDIANGPQPIRTAMAIYFGWMLVSYAFVTRRHLSMLELNGANRSVITAFTLFGVAAVAADGIRDRKRLEKLISVWVTLASIVALLGLIQFFTPFDPVAYIRIPGMELTREISSTTARGILNRPFSTTLHPIEFGVVMAMVFPLALYRLWLPGAGARDRALRWIPVLLIGTAVPLTVSRSALLALIVAVGYFAVALSARSRLNLAGAACLAVVAARVAVPGLVGTFTSLFLGSGDDPSVQSRLSDVTGVLNMVNTRPWLGWGPGIFNVEEYTLLDNQYYVTTIEIGIIGLALVMAMLIVAVIVGRSAGKGADEVTRRLSYALVGSVLAGGVAMATFDGFGFRIFTGTLFLLMGTIGALWRLQLLPTSRDEADFIDSAGTLKPEPRSVRGRS